MGERLNIKEMATTSTAVATTVPVLQEDAAEPVAVITLRQTRPKQRERKKVVWTEDTVDNENMNKKKSKCCCIYEKPRKFGESDSDDSDDECEHCFGHVERRKARQPAATDVAPAATVTQVQEEPVQPTVEVTLKPKEPAPSGSAGSPRS